MSVRDEKGGLSPDDQRLTDLLADAGYDPAVLAGMSAEDRARGEQLLSLMSLLERYPVDDADDTLVAATLVRIDRYEEDRSARLSFDTQRAERTGRRLPIPDFISVAAVILVAVAVLWPVLSTVREHSIDLACSNNLRKVGQGFGMYAGDNDGRMPMAVAGANLTWDKQPNVVNLEPLVDGGYCEHGHLNCPGVGDHAVSTYSYQWQLPGAKVGWGIGERTTLILGDRNPLIDAFLRNNQRLAALTISLNHGGRGQNVLASDGSAQWLKDPVFGSDDFIWVPQGLSTLREGAVPESWDVFLAH